MSANAISPSLRLPWGLLLALLAGLAIIFLPEQAGLPLAGQRMLAMENASLEVSKQEGAQGVLGRQ